MSRAVSFNVPAGESVLLEVGDGKYTDRGASIELQVVKSYLRNHKDDSAGKGYCDNKYSETVTSLKFVSGKLAQLQSGKPVQVKMGGKDYYLVNYEDGKLYLINQICDSLDIIKWQTKLTTGVPMFNKHRHEISKNPSYESVPSWNSEIGRSEEAVPASAGASGTSVPSTVDRKMVEYKEGIAKNLEILKGAVLMLQGMRDDNENTVNEANLFKLSNLCGDLLKARQNMSGDMRGTFDSGYAVVQSWVKNTEKAKFLLETIKSENFLERVDKAEEVRQLGQLGQLLIEGCVCCDVAVEADIAIRPFTDSRAPAATGARGRSPSGRMTGASALEGGPQIGYGRILRPEEEKLESKVIMRI